MDRHIERPAQHIIGHSGQPITWLVQVNQIKQQPNYNISKLSNTYK